MQRMAGIASLLAVSPALAEEKGLYERLGGVYAIASVVDMFIDRLLARDGVPHCCCASTL